MGMLEPEQVRGALDRMRTGEASEEVFSILVDAATAFAALEPEFVTPSPQTGLYYVTRNDMLVETMRVAKPDSQWIIRLAPPYPTIEQAATTPEETR